MAVTSDILRTWRAPRDVVRDHLARGKREDRALAFLMIACLILFVVRWPALVREAELTGAELDRLIAYAMLGTVVILPLLLYLVAALGWLLGRLVWRGLRPFGARIALFWALLAASPAAVLYGLVAGFIGPGPQATLVGAIWVAAVLWFWTQGLRAAGQEPGA